MGMEERTDLVFEARKEKKKRKEKRKKGELDANSSLIEVLEDKIGEVVKVQKFKKSDGTNRESEEGATKKKKRKRDVEGTDVEIQMYLTKEQELINDCENPNGKIMEEVDCADTEKKRKKHFEVDKIGDTAKRSKHSKDRDVTEMNNVEVGKRKKKKKEKREKVVGELLQNIITEGKEAGVESEHSEGQILKKAKKNHRKNSRSEMQETVYLGTKSGRFLKDGFLEKDGATLVTDESSSKTREDVNEGDGNKKRKRAKSEKHVNKGDCDKEKKKKAKSFKGSIRPPKKVTTSDLSENSTPRKAPKRVSFSDEVEVFSPSDDPKDAEDKKKLVWGKRFSKDEDELIKKAVHTYIEEHQLGSREEGIEKILKCNKCPEIRNCWKHIAEALPWRPYRAVYARGHNLFERSMDPKWTEEELNEVKLAAEEFEAKGMRPNWTKLAIKLGKYRVHVKDAYRRVKLANMKKGSFSQEEYQTLFDLVNKDLQMRALQEKKSKHGMLRDNIAFEAISQCMGTRTNAILCQKWYYQLASPMVAEGEWKDADDYLLIYALDSLDAFCIEDVDWDDLLEHRSGDVCRKRWNQMVKHIGQHGTKSFTEQLEILSKRYCADALEARKVYDSKPVVD